MSIENKLEKMEGGGAERPPIFIPIEAYAAGLAMPLEAFPASSHDRWATAQQGRRLLADGERAIIQGYLFGRLAHVVVGVWDAQGVATPEELEAELQRILKERVAAIKPEGSTRDRPGPLGDDDEKRTRTLAVREGIKRARAGDGHAREDDDQG